jgi:hypothetical protein
MTLDRYASRQPEPTELAELASGSETPLRPGFLQTPGTPARSYTRCFRSPRKRYGDDLDLPVLGLTADHFKIKAINDHLRT